jgi:hypothetical protein
VFSKSNSPWGALIISFIGASYFSKSNSTNYSSFLLSPKSKSVAYYFGYSKSINYSCFYSCTPKLLKSKVFGCSSFCFCLSPSKFQSTRSVYFFSFIISFISLDIPKKSVCYYGYF